jgi:hypothetical protein
MYKGLKTKQIQSSAAAWAGPGILGVHWPQAHLNFHQGNGKELSTSGITLNFMVPCL